MDPFLVGLIGWFCFKEVWLVYITENFLWTQLEELDRFDGCCLQEGVTSHRTR